MRAHARLGKAHCGKETLCYVRTYFPGRNYPSITNALAGKSIVLRGITKQNVTDLQIYKF